LLIYRVFGGFGVFHVLALINLTILLTGCGGIFRGRRPGPVPRTSHDTRARNQPAV